ncbi:MAG: alpha/beta hydrolase [Dehalococcoidia bacterium]
MEGITDEVRRLFFRYDHDLPLDVDQDPPVELDGLGYQRVVFWSTHHQRVPAVVVNPLGEEGRRPVLMIQHGAGGRKDEPRMQGLMSSWARHGFLCICSDSPLHGERGGGTVDPRLLLQRPYTGLDFIVQYVVDLMRTVDYLQTRGDADISRLGYAGFSMSTILGVQFVALDQRVRAASFAIGGAGLFHFFSGWLPQDQREDHETVATLMDPMHYAPLISPRPVVMVNSLRDTLLPPPLGHVLFNALQQPKQIHWYDGPHGDIPTVELEWIRKFFTAQLQTAKAPQAR